jgi:hypothetical protein
MPSLAACIQKDIIVLTRHPASGMIDPRPHLYTALLSDLRYPFLSRAGEAVGLVCYTGDSSGVLIGI